MAKVLPFRGIRFSEAAGPIENLVCPPYDIISEEQRKNYLKTNENNIIRLELPREGKDVYQKADETLKSWLKNGTLKQDEKPQFYVYEQTFTVNNTIKKLRGLIARVKLTDFSEGVVIPHENTLSAAKEDRYKLMCATACNFSQVYCLFDDANQAVTDILNQTANQQPVVDFEQNGIEQKMWLTDNPNITAAFEDKKLYIADGHHRYETALRYRNEMRAKGATPDSESEYVMMMLVPMQCDGLVVLPTHRVLHSFNEFNGRKMMLECRRYFHVGEMSTPEILQKYMNIEYQNGKVTLGAYVNKRYFILTLKGSPTLQESMPNENEVLRNLDVVILHNLILEGIMGIDKENMARQQNLSYTRDISEAVEMVENGANCAFFLNPTRIEQIAGVGDAGQKMPQKSTYFYPKLITGLVINPLF